MYPNIGDNIIIITEKVKELIDINVARWLDGIMLLSTTSERTSIKLSAKPPTKAPSIVSGMLPVKIEPKAMAIPAMLTRLTYLYRKYGKNSIALAPITEPMPTAKSAGPSQIVLIPS